VVDLGECYFARVFSDGLIEKVFALSSNVPNKHKKGGQSAARFARLRDNEITQWFKEINECLKTVEGEFYVGISQVYYKRFLKHLHTYNKAKVKDRRSSEGSNLSGVYDIINGLEREKK